MKFYKGDLLIVHDKRKGTYKAVAENDFDTEKSEFYPVATREFVNGMSTYWEVGDSIPCRSSLCEIELEKK